MSASSAWLLVMWHGGVLIGVGAGNDQFAPMVAGVIVSIVSAFAFKRHGGHGIQAHDAQ